MNFSNEKPFWVDHNYNSFEAGEVNDDYLKRIVYELAEGLGVPAFVDAGVVSNVFKEAYRRKLLRADLLLTLNLWAEYHWGVTEYRPRYKVTWEGEHVAA